MDSTFMQPMRISPALITGWSAACMKIRSAPLLMGLEILFEHITLLCSFQKYFLIAYCVLDMALSTGNSVGE